MSTIVTESISSTALPAHIDTYEVFQLGDDSYHESMSEHIYSETGIELGYDDFSWRYDNKGWLEWLACRSVEWIMENIPDDSIVKGIKITETFSPAYYNFSTDGYMADWDLDLDALREYCKGVEFHDGRGVSGFMRTADDHYWELAHMLSYYLLVEAWQMDPSEIDTKNDVFLSAPGVTSYEYDLWEWASSCCAHDEFIIQTPNTVAALEVWAILDYGIDDELVNMFAARKDGENA